MTLNFHRTAACTSLHLTNLLYWILLGHILELETGKSLPLSVSHLLVAEEVAIERECSPPMHLHPLLHLLHMLQVYIPTSGCSQAITESFNSEEDG
jgi:hypothetical protein